MTEKLERDAPLPPASMAAIVEELPSREMGVSALASAAAPYIYFDGAPYRGIGDGVAEITLVARRHISRTCDGAIGTDHVVTAHLRCSLRTLVALRQAIDDVLLLATSTPTDTAS